MHKLHTGGKGAARQTTSHCIFGPSFLSLRFHKCRASAVLVLPSGFPRSWAPNLSLNVLAVRPTYVSTELVPVNVPLKTRHFPDRGQLVGSRQLHVGGASVFSSLNILLLCPEVCDFRSRRHRQDSFIFLLVRSGWRGDPGGSADQLTPKMLPKCWF